MTKQNWKEKLKQLLTDFTAKDDFVSVEDFIEFIVYNLKPAIKDLLKAERERTIEDVIKFLQATNPNNKHD